MENKKIIKVCIFDHKASPFLVTTTNGDAILDNIIIEAKTDENLFTGEYYLDLIGLVDIEGLHKYIAEEAIVKVHMDYGDEYFRIAKIDKSTRDIRAFARQITISETLDMWLEDTRPTDTSGQGALTILRDNSIGKKDIQVFSDITDTSTAYYQKMSMYKALHDCDQSFENRWGGEIQRRGYNLTINKKIGMDRGVQIRSRKNLTGFEAKIDIDNVCTRISAKGYDGIQAKNFIDSPLINKYSAIKTKLFKYDFVKLKNENNPDEGYNTLEEAQAELERLAKLEFTKNHIDELRANYKINFVQLEYTEEYKNYVQAERIYLGDTVSVFEEKYNINIHVRAIRKKFDVLRQRVIEIELSNIDIKDKTLTTSDILSELQNIIKETDNNNVQDIIQSMINSGIKDSYVIHRQNEIIVADDKDLSLAHNVVRLNKNGLAFSQNGYYGKYSYGFTINGIINASLIATGILNADLLRTGVIRNKDGTFEIDLSSKKGIMTKKNGVNAIELSGTDLNLYDWDGEGDPVGKLYSSRLDGNASVPGVVLANMLNSFLALSYWKDDNFYSYIRCDKDNIDGTTNVPITIFEESEFKGKEFWFGYGINSIYNSVSNNLIMKVLNSFTVTDIVNGNNRLSVGKDNFNLYDANNNTRYFFANNNSFTFYEDNIAYFYKNKDQVVAKKKLFADAGAYVRGDFTVAGNKNCVQTTKNYGDRLFYSVEDCESYLTDTGKSKTTLTEHNTYERVILIDNIYKECIDLTDYHIEINKYDWGDYRIKEQTENYFVVESEKEMKFSWTIKAKRKGFEDLRNKESFMNIDITPNAEYWRLYANNEVGDTFGSK